MFILKQDNDGHWYVVPENRDADFETWIALDGDATDDAFNTPEWAEPVGGAPSLVKFSEYEIL